MNKNLCDLDYNGLKNYISKHRYYLEMYIQRDYPKLYEYLENKYPGVEKYSEKLWLCYNDFDEVPKCIVCGAKAKFICFSLGYSDVCSKSCSYLSPKRKERREKTCIKKYGVPNPSQSEEIKIKKINTCRKNFGVDYYIQGEQNKKSIRETCIKKYGVPNPSLVKEFVEKRKSTILKKYGAPTYAQSFLKQRYPELISFDKNKWTFKCPHPECTKCEEKQYTTLAGIYYDRIRSCSEQCTHLLPLGGKIKIKGTTIELIVRNILDKHNIYHIDNCRKIITPYELDLYLPEYNIGIECNGEKWHQDPSKEIRKQNLCKLAGVKLLTFWGKEIINDPESVEKRILEELNIS